MIDLLKGDDEVIGFPDSPHIFLVGDGYKQYAGGNKDDLFILEGSDIFGTINGLGGFDSIQLSDESFVNITPLITIGANGDNYNYGYITYRLDNITEGIVTIREIENVVGRKKTEVIKWYGGNYTINSNGGSFDQPDSIVLQGGRDEDRVVIIINGYTSVFNNASSGSFQYNVSSHRLIGNALFDLSYSNMHSTSHQFYLDYNIFDVQHVDIQSRMNGSITQIKLALEQMNLNIYVHTDNGSNNKTSYYFKDGTELKIGGGHVYAMQTSGKSVKEIIQEYPSIAERLMMFIVVRSNVNNAIVSIGQGEHEVITNDAFHNSHLIGGKGEDVYVINSGYRKLNSSDDLVIPDTTIYNFHALNQTDTLDLRKLSKQIEEDLGYELLLENIRKDGGDVLIELFIPTSSDPQGIKYVTAIRLKDGFENHWYERLQVILNNAPMKIDYHNGTLSLLPMPIFCGRDKELIVITARDIDRNTELHIPKKIGQYDFFYIDAHNMKHSLVVTNFYDCSIKYKDCYTVLLSNFYENLEKMETLSIQFVDNNITIKDEVDKIDNATQYEKCIYDAVFSQMDIISLSHE